jgi:bifunctional UDP-N-acetylglucosamine pyrophosphorylase/glucosamine-1-phosphate N-acetyltransferase
MTSKRPERTAPPRGISLKPKSVAIAIMAAGKGTRLKSKHPKVLHEVGGKPLLAHVIAAASRVLPAEDVYVIIGHEAERVREATRSTGVNFVRQEPQRGTGHALMCAAPSLSAYDHVVVLSGDAPLITAETISGLR